MRRMFSLKQLEEIANRQIQEQVSSGNLENVKIFEKIVDKDGHNRFIEGNISPSAITGFNFTYHKWSLSGTHLMVILAGKIDANTTMNTGILGEIQNLPEWLRNKIYPSGSSEFIVSAKHAEMWYDSTLPVDTKLYGAIQQGSVSDTRLVISTWNNAWSNANDVYFRFAFDLLIDNE